HCSCSVSCLFHDAIDHDPFLIADSPGQVRREAARWRVSGRKDVIRLSSLAPAPPLIHGFDGYQPAAMREASNQGSLSASGSVIRKALKSLEALKWVDKSEDGKGRILSKQGRKDLDRIAADLRSTAAPAEL
ncbi:hypothetical protein PRIPAC_87827, partial [Pristionchus pacificus]|uniref:Ribosomal protein n=1 Tax=Pristionchus pacificus TaxID=54126 RepID=A0A2A6B7B0_PRIPA